MFEFILEDVLGLSLPSLYCWTKTRSVLCPYIRGLSRIYLELAKFDAFFLMVYLSIDAYL